MKNAIVVFIAITFPFLLDAQNVGIGTVTPSEKLEVEGAINIGINADESPEAGTIRWNNITNDFEGYNGTEWVSLTKQNSTWGNPPVSSSIENNKLIPLDAATNDKFGSSVSISGDFAIIGAPGDSASAGSAYIFSRSGDIWNEEAKFTASLPDNQDFFGHSVSIEGDIAIVAANSDDDGGNTAGAAYIFVKPESGWVSTTETAKLTASDASEYNNFGQSVAISGNIAVIGAVLGDNLPIVNTGSAYIFEKPGGGWSNITETAKLTASDASENDQFGLSVAISGDIVIIGARAEDNVGGVNAGSAYIFEKPDSGWINMTETAKLTASDASASDLFGHSVAISADYAIIGANEDDNLGGVNAGSAYIFEKPGSGWINMTETAKLTASDASGDDRFGFSVAISGDNAIIGACFKDNVGGVNAGSAYIFEKPIGGWISMTQSAKLIASDSAPNDQFGWSVSISGNYALVGTGTNDAVGSNSGTAYVYKN